MKQSLRKNAHYFEDDPRILPCLMDFLNTKMQNYATIHGWTFDPSDFQVGSILGKDPR